MYCARCNNDIVNCTCPDIEDRLKGLMKNPVVSPAAEQNLRARIEFKPKEKSKELQIVSEFVGKKASITFESKRHNGLFTQTGKIISASEEMVVFDPFGRYSDYPEGAFDCLNTSRVREVKEA